MYSSTKTLMIVAILVVSMTSISLSTSAQEPETHIITVQDNAFSPSILRINIGDSIRFEWAEGARGHNVVQTQSSNSIQPLENGFSSGEPQNAPNTFVLDNEFTSKNTTLFFMCEPHATSGMTGEIIVGEGGLNVEAPIMQYLNTITSIILCVILVKDYRKNLRST